MQIDHEAAGDVPGQAVAVVAGDEGERQVHAGQHAGRRPHVAVLDVEGVGVDVHAGVAAAQVVGDEPVRGGAAAVEQPGLGEQERAAAHRRRTPRAPREPGDLPDERGVGQPLGYGGPARHQQRVHGLGDLGERPGHDRHPVARRDVAAGDRPHLDLIGVAADQGRGAEDVGRPGHVEQLETGEDDDEDSSLHAFMLVAAHGWRQ
ncbi:hypothetical protein GCM10020001_084320 [Nonomuraea salmonea]